MKEVLLSSTSQDLKPFRDAVYASIEGLDGYHCVRMEDFGARDGRPEEYCEAAVAHCDLYVGLVGHLYGTIPDGYDKSHTELEYDAAIHAGKPRLVFLAGEKVPIAPSLIENDDKQERLVAFRERIDSDRVRETFETPEGLCSSVIQAIFNWQGEAIRSEQDALEAGKTSREEVAIEALRRLFYQIAEVSLNGEELFQRIGSRITRHRDAFQFRQEVAHEIGVESRSVPEQEILADFVTIGVIHSEYHAQPAPAGPESGVARPVAPQQYIISDLGRSVLTTLKASIPSPVLRIRPARRQDTAGFYVRNRTRSRLTHVQVTLSYLSLPNDGDVDVDDDPFFARTGLAWSFDHYGREEPDQSVIDIPNDDDRFVDLFVTEGTELRIVSANPRVRGRNENRLVLAGRYALELTITADQFAAITVKGYSMRFTHGSWEAVILPNEERDLFSPNE